MRHTDNDMEEGEAMSPVDRLDRMASRLTQAGAALQKVADAAKPLYASLDNSQKRIFGFLAHEMMTMGHGPGEMGPQGRHHGHHEEEGGPGGRRTIASERHQPSRSERRGRLTFGRVSFGGLRRLSVAP